MSVMEKYINNYRRLLPQIGDTEEDLKEMGFNIVERDLEVKTTSIMSDSTYARRKVKHPIDMVEDYNKQGYDVIIVETFRDLTVLRYSVAIRSV